MRLSDRTDIAPEVTPADVHRERSRSPHARQLCEGSMLQLMEDAAGSVTCPKCRLEFNVFDVQKNRDQRCPIVPSHLPDPRGRTEVAAAELKRRKNDTPRPY